MDEPSEDGEDENANGDGYAQMEETEKHEKPELELETDLETDLETELEIEEIRHFPVRLFGGQLLQPHSRCGKDTHENIVAPPRQPDNLIGNPGHHWHQRNPDGHPGQETGEG